MRRLFAVNAQHYASVAYLRKEPIFGFGVLVMFIQGSVLAYLYTQTVGSVRSIAVCKVRRVRTELALKGHTSGIKWRLN